VKVKILAEPGELEVKAYDVVRVVEELSGQTLLKAESLPKLNKWQVLYAKPNPDGTRKQCANCPMWNSKHKLCSIHSKEQTVTADMICGYHVFGKPVDKHPNAGIDPVAAEGSGLEAVKGGTSCDLCSWYHERHCGLLRSHVHPKACCSAWEAEQKLSKAAVLPNKQIKQTAAQFEYKVLEGTVNRSKREADRMARVLKQKIAAVLKG